MPIATFNLSDLNGSNGFALNGIDEFDYAGSSVSDAGDINGDGIDDIIIGAFYAAPNGKSAAGESYVVFGSEDGFSASLDLSSLNGSNGFVINGIDAFDFSGDAVSGAGDINGDGIDDIVIGASRANANAMYNAGESYVVFGSEDGFSVSLELSQLNGSNGFVLNGIDEYDNSGTSVSGVGDINGDGIDDIIIGALGADANDTYRAGESYVVFGSEDGFSASFDLSRLNGSNGFVINGVDEYDSSGTSVSGAGDINGDGIDDLIIGARNSDPNNNVGESYVVFGSEDGFSASLNLSSLNGSNGFVIQGIDEPDLSGPSLSGAGDINGDGIDDLIIGESSANPDGKTDAGKSYVVFGSEDSFSASLNLANLNGDNGFVLNGIDENDASGKSVSGAGDINGDGIDDLIIGAFRAGLSERSFTGESYIVFGSANGFEASLDLSSLNGPNGFVISGVNTYDSSGYSVSRAGDINGDGIDDILIGANSAYPNRQRSGASYVVFGSEDGFNITTNELIEGTPARDILRGGRSNDTLEGFAGNDKLTGQSGNDVLVGGQGNDFLLGGRGFDTLEGGEGQDRFVFQNPRQAPDRILDFEASEDLILIKQSGFDLNFKGRLPQSRFVRGGVRDRNDRFIYKASSGELLFDGDGIGGQVAQVIANLRPGNRLNATNIRII